MLPTLDVFILYEDFGTGLRAKRSLDLLPNRFTGHTPLTTKLWRIELLSDPLLGEQAIVEASAADVMILSVHGRGELPDGVCKWLSGWLSRREKQPCALGVLLDAGDLDQGRKSPVISYMQRVAAAAQADLFYGFSEATVSEMDAAMEEINQRARSSSAVLENMLRRAEPHAWLGINE